MCVGVLCVCNFILYSGIGYLNLFAFLKSGLLAGLSVIVWMGCVYTVYGGGGCRGMQML